VANDGVHSSELTVLWYIMGFGSARTIRVAHMDMPAGTVTFLFTDIEGSTRLWERHPVAMRGALARHDALLAQLIARHHGAVFKTVGDAFCAAFPDVADGVACAVAAQRALAALEFPEIGTLRVRMALHAGEPELRDGDYFGPPVNRVARLLSAGHGGQILLSANIVAGLNGSLPADLSLSDLGTHTLRDVPDPVHIWQLDVAGLPQTFRPLKTLDYDPTNVPAPLTTFVGRAEPLAEVGALLARPDVRLVTLTGPGGIGKTRLATHLATQLRDAFPDGRYLASLAAITDPALVPQATAAALGVQESGDQPLIAAIEAELRPKRLLLILDNFEQVLPAAPQVTALLRAAPKLTVLVTSREALHVYGEQAYDLEPLTVPDVPARATAADVAGEEAVALFVARAQAAKPDFALTDENAATIAAICQRLDGLPLAIELAAARSRRVPPRQMLDRLTDQLAFLERGSVDLPERQQSLRAAIDWSYNLLTPAEQTLFARLAVFNGGMAEDAIAPVAAGEEFDPLDPAPLPVPPLDDAPAIAPVADGLEILDALVTASLVQIREPDGDDAPRYAMLATIRAYAAERLVTAGEDAAVRVRHARWVRDLARTADQASRGPEQMAWLDQLESENDNIRAALGWLAEQGAVAAELQIGAALCWFWQRRGHMTEGRDWLRRALAEAPEAVPQAIRAEALNAAGILALRQSDTPAAKALLAETLALRQQMGDDAGTVGPLNNLGLIALRESDLERAAELFEGAIAKLRPAGEPGRLAVALNNLGMVKMDAGELDAADRLFEEALTLRRVAGDRFGVANTLGNLALIAAERGDGTRSLELHREVLALARETDDALALAQALINVEAAMNELGIDEPWLPMLEEARALAEETGDQEVLAAERLNHGGRLIAQGDRTAGARMMAESVPMWLQQANLHGLAGAVHGLVEVALDTEQPERAAILLGAFAARVLEDRVLRQKMRDNLAQITDRTRAALGPDFEPAFAAGRACTDAQMAAEADRIAAEDHH
jgi:predicted ATPase/class 3 adenylate cyclase